MAPMSGSPPAALRWRAFIGQARFTYLTRHRPAHMRWSSCFHRTSPRRQYWLWRGPWRPPTAASAIVSNPLTCQPVQLAFDKRTNGPTTMTTASGGQDAGFANDLSTAGATPSSRLRTIVGWDGDYWLDRGTALGVHRLCDAERSSGRRMGRAHRARATSG